jgi:hypothetical protein
MDMAVLQLGENGIVTAKAGSALRPSARSAAAEQWLQPDPSAMQRLLHADAAQDAPFAQLACIKSRAANSKGPAWRGPFAGKK